MTKTEKTKNTTLWRTLTRPLRIFFEETNYLVVSGNRRRSKNSSFIYAEKRPETNLNRESNFSVRRPQIKIIEMNGKALCREVVKIKN